VKFNLIKGQTRAAIKKVGSTSTNQSQRCRHENPQKADSPSVKGRRKKRTEGVPQQELI